LEASVPDSAILHLSSPGSISNHCGVSSGTENDASVTAIKVGTASP
jgi:hypothetical protein